MRLCSDFPVIDLHTFFVATWPLLLCRNWHFATMCPGWWGSTCSSSRPSHCARGRGSRSSHWGSGRRTCGTSRSASRTGLHTCNHSCIKSTIFLPGEITAAVAELVQEKLALVFCRIFELINSSWHSCTCFSINIQQWIDIIRSLSKSKWEKK